MDNFLSARQNMVLRQIEGRGIGDQRVLDAMQSVPRHLFVSGLRQNRAYRDEPLAIGHYQTISQPYVVALMCEALELTENCKCLEVGGGSGYAAAVLSELCRKVISIERIPELAELVRENLKRSGYSEPEVHCADGSLGFTVRAPYDAIVVAAAAPAVPGALKSQLKPGGRLVIPIGADHKRQDLLRIRRSSGDRFQTENLGSVAFVPLIGEEGWQSGISD